MFFAFRLPITIAVIVSSLALLAIMNSDIREIEPLLITKPRIPTTWAPPDLITGWASPSRVLDSLNFSYYQYVGVSGFLLLLYLVFFRLDEEYGAVARDSILAVAALVSIVHFATWHSHLHLLNQWLLTQ